MFTSRFFGRFKKKTEIDVDHNQVVENNLEVVDIDISDVNDMPEFRLEDF